MGLAVGTSIAYLIITFVCYMAFAITSFGTGIVFQIAYYTCSIINDNWCDGDLTRSVALFSLLALVLQTYQSHNLKGIISKPLAWLVIPMMTVGTIFGTLILIQIGSSFWAKRALGYLFFIVAIVKIRIEIKEVWAKIVHERATEYIKEHKDDGFLDKKDIEEHNTIMEHVNEVENIPKKPKDSLLAVSQRDLDYSNENEGIYDPTAFTDPKKKRFILFFSFFSGITAGLFGVGGPPLMIITAQGWFSKDRIRATIAFAYAFTNIFRCLVLIITGDLLNAFGGSWLVGICLFFGGIGGLLFGNFLSQFVDQVMFRRLVLVILLFGSTSMGTAEMDIIVFFIILAIIIFSLGIVASYLNYHLKAAKSPIELEREIKDEDEKVYEIEMIT